MKKIILLSNVDVKSPAVRYRMIYTLDLLKKEEKVSYEFLHYYSSKTIKSMDRQNQIAKLIYVLGDLIKFICKLFKAKKDYDVIIVKNYIFPFLGALPEKILYKFIKNNRLVYDIDDGLYLNKTRNQNKLFAKFRDASSKIGFWTSKADRVIVSNKIIKNDLINLYNTKTDKFIEFLSCPYKYQYFTNEKDIPNYRRQDEVRFIWLGSPHTQRNLELIADFIKKLPQIFDRVKVYIIGATKDFSLFEGLEHVVALDWTPDIEDKFMKISHFGLNPLYNDEFESRKSAFKVIQYYRAGIVPIASNVGINKELIETYGGYCTDNFNEEELCKYLIETLKNYDEISTNLFNITGTLSVESNKEKVEDAIFI